MLWLIALTSFAAVCCGAILFMGVIMRDRIEIQLRIRKLAAVGDRGTGGVEGTVYERLIKPALGSLYGVIRRITPKNYMSELDRRIKEAGNPMNLNASSLVSIQAGAVMLEIILVFSVWIAFRTPLPKVFIVLSLMLAITYIFPKMLIRQKILERQKEIEKTLPDIIDILTVSIEAGLSFDGAMGKLVEKMTGVLVQEFAAVLKEMKMGVSKKEALKSLIERVPVDNLITFIGAVIQADQLGVSIGNVLRIQSSLMRQKRRQKASELAMKAPIKMLFPMVFFILPTVFIILLGPVIINIIRSFG
ncbi:MAG: type II secretion system F family protein [Bacillota bacterium]